MANRNDNAHFDLAPQVGIERSTFNMDTNIHTSFNVGDLVPFYCSECLPGDTFQIETSKVARLQTLIAPVMDNLYLDTYYFFVPCRLVWDNWKYFMGETLAAWEDDIEYTIPQLGMPYGTGWTEGTLADYFGIPTNVHNDTTADISVNALPFRAYALIYNEWFRDENLQDSLMVYKDNVKVQGNNTNPVAGGKPMKACKYHDYFTSCLPAPQKGPDTEFISGMLPVKTFAQDIVTGSNLTPMKYINQNGTHPTGVHNLISSSNGLALDNNTLTGLNYVQLTPSNLYASVSDLQEWVGGQFQRSTSLTINALRQAFQIQRLLEKDARSGTRYTEVIQAHFATTSPDARLQRPEYLGGNRCPLNIEQVINTTANVDKNLLPGDTSGWSQTSDVNYDVEKSFTEHGYVIGLMCARYDHTYQQGLERMWTRKKRFDFYWPALAHLGEQPVYKQEIYLTKDNFNTRQVFGYQEAWAEYRYKPNYVTGAMRSNVEKSLDIWHFADDYESEPFLSADWIVEDSNNIDRTLAVTSDLENQIFMDIYVKNKATRPMPLYSIPGLIDHF